MSKARNKPGYGRTLEKMRPKKPVPRKENLKKNKKSEADVETSKAAAKWWRKPRVVQFNLGRIEFSMPYQFGVVLVLVSVVLILVAFQLGHYVSTDKNPSDQAVNNTKTPVQEKQVVQQKVPDVKEQPEPIEEIILRNIEEPKPAEPVIPKSTGNNVIVLKQFGSREDLRPVQAHFAEYGIITEIVLEKGIYFLQTKNRYNNPGKPGTDGNEALQEIIRAGAKYKGKAPPGYETFAPRFFSDAYGKKMN
ncbi:MAG: hypothetical protein GY774_11545 [Planctomycetes bacterium]|nr:hypothetical protein [Planctomycetota bacterium]